MVTASNQRFQSLFAVTANELRALSSSGQLYRSQNPGSTWAKAPGALATGLTALSGDSNGRLWAAGANSTITTSFDDGATWTVSNSKAGGETLVGIYAQDAFRVWAVGIAGTVFRTEDAGVSWTSVERQIPQALGGPNRPYADAGTAADRAQPRRRKELDARVLGRKRRLGRRLRAISGRRLGSRRPRALLDRERLSCAGSGAGFRQRELSGGSRDSGRKAGVARRPAGTGRAAGSSLSDLSQRLTVRGPAAGLPRRRTAPCPEKEARPGSRHAGGFPAQRGSR